MAAKVLMLGGSRLQLPAIIAAKKFGFEVICADHDPDAPGFEIADDWSLTSTLDVDGVYELAASKRVSYIITSTSDAPVRVAALVSERLGLPTGIASRDAVCATQKDEMRFRLAKHGIPMPDFRVCRNAQEFELAIEYFGYDCIAKPADSAASRGVRLLTPTDKEIGSEELFEEFAAFSRKGVVMVEERAVGKEVSVEAMTVDGVTTVLAVTDKLTTEPPFFVELGHSEPSMLPCETLRAIKQVTNDVIAAIGVVNGPSHTEIMVTDEGPKVIETAARLGGDFIASKLVALSTGVDLVEWSVAVALGLEYDFSSKVSRGAAIRFITAKVPGKIEKIEFPEELRVAPGFEEISLYLSEGETVNIPHSSNDRIGHVICVGGDADEAIARAEAAVCAIAVTISHE